MTKISNGILEAVISSCGAEMQSLKLVDSNRELLWQGDPQYWGGRSPILFPIVGGLWNGSYHLGDKTLQMPKHGFMRKKEWQQVDLDDAAAVTYEYVSRGEEEAIFPWPYTISVTYRLVGRRLEVEFMVKNNGDTTMYFQIGGHPGIALPDFDAASTAPDGYLKLHGQPQHVLHAKDQGCTAPETYDFPQTDDGLVPLGIDTFANEALIFDAHQVSGATILDKSRRPLVRVESTAPVWLFWSPQGVHSPFICAEPWYGLCDRIGFDGPVEQRPYIIALAPNAQPWHGGYSIDILV